MQNEPPAELVEIAARIIDPSSWAVMDSYLAETKRKYRGQNVGWPADQFHHKESMAKARAVLAAVTPQIEARVTGEIVAWLRELATHTTKFGPTAIADNIESGHFAHWAARQLRDYKESQP